jgi:hypothetical protein
MMKTREYRHPEINHTFIIEDINISEIIIDGIRVNRSDCDWMVMMDNHSGGETATMNDLSLPFLQHILDLKH